MCVLILLYAFLFSKKKQVSQKFVGEYCDITILRNRKVETKRIQLTAPKYLVPECVYDTQVSSIEV
jgi:hypothetical protein